MAEEADSAYKNVDMVADVSDKVGIATKVARLVPLAVVNGQISRNQRLSKNQIRLRYSGFIVFTTQFLGLITGLIFTLLLTRSMTASQFGIWTNIFDYTPYFIIFSGILPFWATRFTARAKRAPQKPASQANYLLHWFP